MTAVALKDVSKIFPGGTRAVDNVSLSAGSGELTVLLGPSGCGKSTVLRMIAGLEQPTSGVVMLNDEIVNGVPPRERGVAVVFQDYALYPHMTVGENIGFPLRLAGVEPTTRAAKAAEVADALGIGDLLERRPQQLSGGQRQRVAMGRAIARRPQLFLMDEPLSNLDIGRRVEMRAEIATLVRELGVTCIYVTHDQSEALTMAHRVAILRKGVLQDVGTPTEVYERPATTFVASFLGNPRMNLLEAEVYVHLDQCVELHLGEQALYLPWTDMRTRQVAHYHGERIVVGVRAEALKPVAPGSERDVLHGRLRYLEHHGHESLAYLDVGATAVAVDEGQQAPPGVHAGGGLRRLVNRVVARSGAGNESRRELAIVGKAVGVAQVGARRGRSTTVDEAGRHHRPPADLAVRLAPYPNISTGQPLTVSVRTEALHFFDLLGKRIDIGWW